jgi:hypothetical protein
VLKTGDVVFWAASRSNLGFHIVGASDAQWFAISTDGDIAIAQVVKRKSEELRITQRIVQGCPTMVRYLLGRHTISTAYIGRLNATFHGCACLVSLDIRTKAPLVGGAHLTTKLQHHQMWNFRSNPPKLWI